MEVKERVELVLSQLKMHSKNIESNNSKCGNMLKTVIALLRQRTTMR